MNGGKTGYKAIKIRSHDDDMEKYLMKNMKYYCKGRGCRHKGRPEPKPTAICFYMKNSVCTHLDIKQRVQDLLPLVPGSKIESIQYVPLSVHLDTPGSDVRWVVTLNSVEARNRIAGCCFHIKGQKVTLRRYDDIAQLEYRKCSRSTNVQNIVSRITQLENDKPDNKTTEAKSTTDIKPEVESKTEARFTANIKPETDAKTDAKTTAEADAKLETEKGTFTEGSES